MNKTGAVAGAGLAGVLGVLGRGCDDAARLVGRGTGLVDDAAPVVTHADDFYPTGVVRYSDDAAGWNASNGNRIIVDQLPSGLEALIKNYNKSKRDASDDPTAGINTQELSLSEVISRINAIAAKHDQLTEQTPEESTVPPTD